MIQLFIIFFNYEYTFYIYNLSVVNPYSYRKFYKLLSSISFNSSLENAILFIASKFIKICSGFDAPIKTLVTMLSFKIQANAI